LGVSDGFQNLNQVEKSNPATRCAGKPAPVLLQASTSLNKAGTLTALSYPPDDIKALMKQAR
jgi:methyl-accepting chemotaxis protein-4 (peptide sensor receptor)